MNNNGFEKMLRSLDVERHQGQVIHGSLIDYVVSACNSKYFILYRANVKERDVIYLHSVPCDGGKKYIIAESPPKEEVYAIAKKLDIDIITEKHLSPHIFGFKENINNGNNDIVDLADKFTKMKSEARILLIITAGWREALIIFCVGFICAFFLSDYLLPFVKSVFNYG